MNTTTWTNVVNEGGEGFNPYLHTVEANTYGPATRQDAIAGLRRDLRALKSIGRACDAAEITAIETTIAALETEIAAAKLAGWTVETTIARRAEWNAIVRTGKIRNGSDVAAAERNLGWTTADLKRAVAAHNL